MAVDIIVIAVLVVLVVLAVRHIISDHKKGIGACGHVCGECSSHCGCTPEKKS